MCVSREEHLKKIDEIVEKHDSSFVTIYGRRVGKTLFVRHFCKINNHFFIEPLDEKEKKIIFLDELPWLDSWKSGFLEELAYFWNNFLSTRADIVLVVCGSAASYMLKKVIHNKGPLHGRVTDIIKIEQFDMRATKELFVKQGCNYSDKSIIELYMVFGGFAFENICYIHIDKIKDALRIGGVPTETHYWNYVPKNRDEIGTQIDMLIEHTNGSKNIDIVECKYYEGIFTIDKAYKEKLINKMMVFNEQTKFKYNIRLIFITVNGVKKNSYYNEIVSEDILLEDLF